MGSGIPDSAAQIEARVKADVQRAAPDSNPYLSVHWLRSLIAGISRRFFDIYVDLENTEERLMPDTADEDRAVRWGGILIGPRNPASKSSGQVVALGTAGSVINSGVSLYSGASEFVTTSSGLIAAKSIPVLSVTRSGSTATVVTGVDHGLSSFVPVSMSGADQDQYNESFVSITVTGPNSFTYEVLGSPATPATGTILASFTSANIQVESVGFGSDTNLSLDSVLKLGSPIAGVGNSIYVTYSEVGGGTAVESIQDYKRRYLYKIRNPLAQFNESAIELQAKKIPGVTRVFVEPAGTVIGSYAVASLTRSGNVARVETAEPHGLSGGQEVTITGALQLQYNVVDQRIIVESDTVFYFVVAGSPYTPASGSIYATSSIPPGQVRTFFVRDNDASPIPGASEVAEVKSSIDEIRPVNTATADNIVLAPTPVDVDFVFTSITPNTQGLRSAVTSSLSQFFQEATSVGRSVDEDAYRAAIIGAVDVDTGGSLTSFSLSSPAGDIAVGSGELAILGTVSYA